MSSYSALFAGPLQFRAMVEGFAGIVLVFTIPAVALLAYFTVRFGLEVKSAPSLTGAMGIVLLIGTLVGVAGMGGLISGGYGIRLLGLPLSITLVSIAVVMILIAPFSAPITERFDENRGLGKYAE